MNTQWYLPKSVIPLSEKYSIRNILVGSGAAIIGESVETLYECTECHAVYNTHSIEPECPLVKGKQCKSDSKKQHLLVSDQPAYILNVPGNRLDLLDQGGIEMKINCWTNGLPSIPITQFELKSFQFRNNISWVKSLAILHIKNIFVNEDEFTKQAFLNWFSSFGEMVRYLNCKFIDSFGYHCLVNVFECEKDSPNNLKITSYKEPIISSHWGNIFLDVSANNQKYKIATKETKNAIILILSSNHHIALSIADIFAQTLASRKIIVTSLTSRQPNESETNIINLLQERKQERQIKIDSHLVHRWLGGRSLHASLCVRLLRQLGYVARSSIDTLFNVSVNVPLYRFDVKNQVDLISDLATSLGYAEHSINSSHSKNFSTSPSLLFGKENEFENYCDGILQTMIGLRFQEVISPDIIEEKTGNINLIEDNLIAREKLISLSTKIKNYYLRKHLLSGLFDHFLKRIKGNNKKLNSDKKDVKRTITKFGKQQFEEASPAHYSLFEIADCYEREQDFEDGIGLQSQRWLAGLISQYIVEQKPHSRWQTLFAEVKAVLDAILRENFSSIQFDYFPEQSPLFITGRGYSLQLQGDNSTIGRFGEIKPELLNDLEIDWPVAIFELNLSRLYEKLCRID